MSDGRNNNDGAFAMATIDGFTQYGLTKREYYTAMVLQGILANSSLATKFWFRNTEDIDCLVSSSVVIADRLIEQLDKECE